MADDKRLIEDYLPIVAISAEASREKSVRKGHISTLHLWWARRPLVACRAAVYGALVPASRFVPENGPGNKKQSLGRANAAKFVTDLCRYPGDTHTIQEAQRHILIAHAERLTQEVADWKAGSTPKPGWVEEFKFKVTTQVLRKTPPTLTLPLEGGGKGGGEQLQFKGDKVAVEDITAERSPRPRVLDMFAGGGAIPLEALRLGCEAYALDLNPVAHIIQLCTLVYPQKYGKPDPAARGMTGPKNEKGETTWGGLAEEVRYWGSWVLKKVKAEIGDLYPPIPDPTAKPERLDGKTFLPGMDTGDALTTQPGFLMPVAYLWTRTVKCKNPACGATVPLVKQTWLCKKKDRFVAMIMVAPKGKKEVSFEVVEAQTEKGLGFDPEAFSKAGNAVCPFCGAVVDRNYVKAEGCAGRMGQKLMAIACTRPGKQGKVYLSADDCHQFVPDSGAIQNAIEELCQRTGLNVPNTPIEARMTGGICLPYGLTDFGKLFAYRQMLCLLNFVAAIRECDSTLTKQLNNNQHLVISTFLAMLLDRLADFNSSLCVFNYTGGRGVVHTFGRQALPMVWDFAETNPFNPDGASWVSGIEDVTAGLRDAEMSISGHVVRGSAINLPWPNETFEAIITDPPYYDNIDYAKLSDFFYVWLKRTIGHLYGDHFASDSAPKKKEIVADPVRHEGNRNRAKVFYEDMMAKSFSEANRVLKPQGLMSVVYAHKTTLGWATLVNALRWSGFTVLEAWPMDTEKPGRLVAQNAAALASSIFLIARKRDPSSKVGNYEIDIIPELGDIVQERVETLWDMGISGADLVIACVGSGLRAFTKYARVEYGNGEEVPAERFLAEVETVVLETILGKLSKTIGVKDGETSLAGLDPATRFYVLWRYTYGAAELDAGEAIIFANGAHVELEGQHSLTRGTHALLEKKKSKYHLRDYTERGKDEKLGIRAELQTESPRHSAIDALHRLLWLLEHKPPKVQEFLNEAKPNLEQLRLIAQALAGPALKGGELADVSPTAEQSALGKLLANWNAIMVGKAVVEDHRAGQQRLFKE